MWRGRPRPRCGLELVAAQFFVTLLLINEIIMARFYYDFPNGTPMPIKAAFGTMFSNFLVNFSLPIWAEHWTPRQPSIGYSYPLRFKGGIVAYVSPAIGYYIDWGFWAHFAFLAVIGLLFWYYERTGCAIRYR